MTKNFIKCIPFISWKNFHQKFYNLKPPIFGLNFLDDKEIKNKNFMLLCGFEKFDNFFVRIDILERLFVLIINSISKKNSEINYLIIFPSKHN